jgi:hypothetical protein
VVKTKSQPQNKYPVALSATDLENRANDLWQVRIASALPELHPIGMCVLITAESIWRLKEYYGTGI